jgi:hypothetical protein
MDAREISIEFAEAFCASDLARLESILAPQLRLRGPLFSFDSRNEYLRSLHENPPEPGGCAILWVHGSDSEAAILYEYRKPGAPVLVAQFNRLSGRLISEVRLVFDTAQALRSS